MIQSKIYCFCLYFSYCLGLREGTVQALEQVTLQNSDSANPTYWICDSTTGYIHPYDRKKVYMVTMDIKRNFKPIQLWYDNSSPAFNHSRFIIRLCN